MKKIEGKRRHALRLVASGVETGHPYCEPFMKYRNVLALERNLLVAHIGIMYIHEGGDSTIRFAYADQHMQILEFVENKERGVAVVAGGRATARALASFDGRVV